VGDGYQQPDSGGTLLSVNRPHGVLIIA